MDLNAIAGMIFTLVLALLIGGFILLYPLSKRLGLFLESKLEKSSRFSPGLTAADVEALRATLTTLQADMQRIADRQDFMEQLLRSKQEPVSLPASGRGIDR